MADCVEGEEAVGDDEVDGGAGEGFGWGSGGGFGLVDDGDGEGQEVLGGVDGLGGCAIVVGWGGGCGGAEEGFGFFDLVDEFVFHSECALDAAHDPSSCLESSIWFPTQLFMCFLQKQPSHTDSHHQNPSRHQVWQQVGILCKDAISGKPAGISPNRFRQ